MAINLITHLANTDQVPAVPDTGEKPKPKTHGLYPQKSENLGKQILNKPSYNYTHKCKLC